ncbi:MAG: SUMF1/EgtB/PvdO family nonheme iron enzyme [Pelobacteraceae bacterium]
MKKICVTALALACLFVLTVTGAHAAPPVISMVMIDGGCFMMGDLFGVGNSDEKPVHEVCIKNFRIGTYEVTQAQWVQVMGENPSKFKGDDLPVENVSWSDAQEFIRKLNAQSGMHYRLPTEAEWEYAARSGGKKEKWAGTSDSNQVGEYAWYHDNSNAKTHAVGLKKPNGLGLYDMSGNVGEWCQDQYGETWYEKSGRDNPQGPATGSARIHRGGGWQASSGILAADRDRGAPDDRNDDIGFRLVLSAAK